VALHRIRKGLDLPIPGAPAQVLQEGNRVTRVGVLAADFPGLQPRLLVAEGQRVRRGEVLFEDLSRPGVRHTAPGAGRVAAIHHAPDGALSSVVIHLSEAEQSGSCDESELVPFTSQASAGPELLERAQVQALLLESGLWTALRTRPFSRPPLPGSAPRALFVTALDSQPLAPRPELAIRARRRDFDRGLAVLDQLTDGPTYLCVASGSGIEAGLTAPVRVEHFEGPHPSGTPGLHIHCLEPAGRDREVWHIGYQDVIAVGELFATGRLAVERIVALAGPPVLQPRLVRARLGVSVDELMQGEVEPGELRLISGSVLAGRTATGRELGYLGRFHQQVSALREERGRRLLGWLAPGRRRYSSLPVFLSRLRGGRRCEFTTSTHGPRRAVLPRGLYERVLPLDLLPAPLLIALCGGDVRRAEQLGALELDEEDLALCGFVDPGKNDFGPALRRALEQLEGQR
jgi:Na+-transporting NADH:ubiquinone oxidoreductase subunit A